MRYKIIKEYPKYYLALSEAGYKECFSKCEKWKRFKIVDEIYIIKIKSDDEN